MTLTLGATRRGRQLQLTNEERARHIHVLGGSGTGKSKLLESLVRQDIIKGRGLCLIDPHGSVADPILEWCAAMDMGRYRRIHVIDLKSNSWSAGFNPLRLRSADEITRRVDYMVAACAEVWGGEDINATPLLSTCLQLVFFALASHGLTLIEAVDLTASVDTAEFRSRLVSALPDWVYQRYWRELSALPRREFEERFSSTRRRLLRFLGSPAIRRMLGQARMPLDMRKVMDEGEIVIANLAPGETVSEENARLFGALLLSEIRLTAITRDLETAKRRPFTFYVDECYDYLTSDVEKMLDQTRKFGAHACLLHQRLGQLGPPTGPIYNGVMAGGQTKIVFGGLTDDDAAVMAKEAFRSTFNLQRPKHVLDKPVATDEVPFWLESSSTTTGSSHTTGSTETTSWSQSTGSSEGLSERFLGGQDNAEALEALARVLSTGSFSGESSGGGSSSSSSETTSSSATRGLSQTLRPVRKIMPTAVHSLEEELHLAILKLRELPNQAAFVKRRGHPPVRFTPTQVKPPLSRASRTVAFVDSVCTTSPYIASVEQADAEIAERLQSQARPTSEPSADEPETFWTA